MTAPTAVGTRSVPGPRGAWRGATDALVSSPSSRDPIVSPTGATTDMASALGMVTPRIVGEKTVVPSLDSDPVGGIPAAVPQMTDPRSDRQNGTKAARATFQLIGVAFLATFTVTRRGALERSVGLLGHLHLIWVPVALGLEWSSMSVFARMQRRLISAGGASLPPGGALATVYGANALSTSVPLAGAGLGASFTFRRFRRHGVDPPLAAWSLMVGGIVSPVAGILILVVGAFLLANDLLAAAGVVVGILGVVGLVLLHTAARHSRVRSALVRAAWVMGRARRLLRRSAGNPHEEIRAWFDRLGSLHAVPSVWIGVSSFALANWLTDAGVLAASIYAIGAPVPWRGLLLVYGSGAVVGSLGITPGGLGLVEGTLCLGLVSAGVPGGQALASVLLYRLISFWMVAAAGWVILLFIHGDKRVSTATIQSSAT